MNPAENYTYRYLETDDLDQYNALLRYTFQVTEDELTATGWKDDEIKQSKFPVLERADGLLFVPKPHVGIQLKCEGAARIFLGQFDQLPVGHVDVVLFARADRGSHLDRNGGHGPPRYKAGQRRAGKKDHRASFHNILSPRVVPSRRTEGPFLQDPGTPAVPGCPFQS